MKWILVIFINLYRLIVPENRRRKCLFRKTCSEFVLESALAEGVIAGLKAFRFRIKQCRSGYELYTNQERLTFEMRLADGTIINQEEIADHILAPFHNKAAAIDLIIGNSK